MAHAKHTFVLIVCLAIWLSGTPLAVAVDTDGDGLLDLIDVPVFTLNNGSYHDQGIEDLDGANQLTINSLGLSRNLITSIEATDFDGINYLDTLYLANNQISSIESGTFADMTIGEGGWMGWQGGIHLNNNRLTKITTGAFAGLKTTTFDISKNPITTIETGAFSGLGTLFFDITDTPLTTIKNCCIRKCSCLCVA